MDMNRSVASWLIERPWHAAFASVLCGVLAPWLLLPFVPFAGAIPAYVALLGDFRRALGLAALAALPAVLILSYGQSTSWLLIAVALLFFGPALLAQLLRKTGSLNLCFQLAVLAIAAGLLIVHVTLDDAIGLWVSILDAALEGTGLAGQDRDVVVALWARTMWGALAALVLASVLGSLFIGRWWLSLVQAPGTFGPEYRRLRLGVVLGVSVTALLIAAFVVESPLLASLVWLAFAAFSFQGLAAAHRSEAGGRLKRSWLAAIYVLLIVPLSTSFTVLALAVWGFFDNWWRARPYRA